MWTTHFWNNLNHVTKNQKIRKPNNKQDHKRPKQDIKNRLGSSMTEAGEHTLQIMVQFWCIFMLSDDLFVIMFVYCYESVTDFNHIRCFPLEVSLLSLI